MSSCEEGVYDVIRQVFGPDDLVLTRDMTADDVDGWDSLGHVTLITLIERRFGIRISEEERDRLATIGDLVDLVEARAST